MELDNFKYNLSRLKKCDQFWDEMNPVLGGRLCSKCDKKIVDFSNMTFTDIAFFMSESKEPICGFYRPEQLKQINFAKSKFPIAISLTTLLAASTITKAEKTYKKIEQNIINTKLVQEIKISSSVITELNNADTLYLVGNIQNFDSTKKINVPVAYATIIVRGSKNGVLTMDNGNFQLGYLPHIDSGKIYLVISSVALKSKVIEIDYKGQKRIELGTIILEQYEGGMTEFWVTAKKRSKLNRFWRKITKPLRRH